MIWIVGNKGMLGTELCLLLKHNNIPFVGTDREVSILNPKALQNFAHDKKITWIVNCAAYTSVDKAEDETELCMALNTNGPENIGKIANKIGTRVIHISTDYVFSGIPSLERTHLRPYSEEDPTNPINVYGKSKAEGELRLLSVSPNSIIIRTSRLYGRHGNNFVFTMLKLMKDRDKIDVVVDQLSSPTWTYDLAKAIVHLIGMQNKLPAGIYHYSNDGEISWYDFALEIYQIAHKTGILSHKCHIHPIISSQYPTKAQRPNYSVLSKEKIKKLGVEVPYWKKSLELFIKTLKQNAD